MTYREKYRQTNPNWADVAHILYCPFDVFDLPPMACPPGECKACWDTEMKEEVHGKHPKKEETLPR